MVRRIRYLGVTTVLAVAMQMMAATSAWADGGVEADALCDPTTGLVMINYSAFSGIAGAAGSNPTVNILFNGVVVDTQAFVAPANAFSGSEPAPAGSGPGDPVTVTAVAVAAWGDGRAGGQSASVVVTLPTEPCGNQPGLGRFTGGGNQVRVGDVRVTRGLTIHCDLLLSNNLEVNWGGNKFHMLEHLTTVACTDDPDIIQAPPPAPLDTLIGTGEGRYNGVAGYTIHFTLVDTGEPGSQTEPDQMSILIFQTSNPGNIVLNVPLTGLTGGNLQAHYDQPHK
jgi:hypothetical protein